MCHPTYNNGGSSGSRPTTTVQCSRPSRNANLLATTRNVNKQHNRKTTKEATSQQNTHIYMYFVYKYHLVNRDVVRAGRRRRPHARGRAGAVSRLLVVHHRSRDLRQEGQGGGYSSRHDRKEERRCDVSTESNARHCDRQNLQAKRHGRERVRIANRAKRKWYVACALVRGSTATQINRQELLAPEWTKRSPASRVTPGPSFEFARVSTEQRNHVMANRHQSTDKSTD